MRKLYDFVCKDCGEEQEKFYQDGDVLKCNNCESENLEKAISAIKSFQFKGTGFYETDYKHK